MTKVGLFSESFEIDEEAEEGVTVRGLALPFGEESRNGARYDADAVRKAAETMKGNSVLWNHNAEEQPLGHVEDVNVTDEGLFYEMNIDPNEEEVLRKLKRGDINNVSIQARVNEENVEGDTVEVDEFLELSLCTIAGFPDTTTSIETITEDPIEVNKGEPFGDWKDFDDCVQDMKKSQGYDEKTAKQVCGHLKDKLESSDSNSSDEESKNKGGNNMTDEEKTEEEPEEEVTEQGNEVEERLETLEGTVDEIKERLSDIEAKLEASEEADDEEDEDEEEAAESKQEPTGKTDVKEISFKETLEEVDE